MRKLIILFMLISSSVYADAIPGFLELDIMHQNLILPGFSDGNIRGFFMFDTIYGASHEYVSPYLHYNLLAKYNKSDSHTFGIGFKIFDNVYIGFDHRLTHYVSPSDYEHVEGTNNNIITVNFKFNID